MRIVSDNSNSFLDGKTKWIFRKDSNIERKIRTLCIFCEKTKINKQNVKSQLLIQTIGEKSKYNVEIKNQHHKNSLTQCHKILLK